MGFSSLTSLALFCFVNFAQALAAAQQQYTPLHQRDSISSASTTNVAGVIVSAVESAVHSSSTTTKKSSSGTNIGGVIVSILDSGSTTTLSSGTGTGTTTLGKSTAAGTGTTRGSSAANPTTSSSSITTPTIPFGVYVTTVSSKSYTLTYVSSTATKSTKITETSGSSTSTTAIAAGKPLWSVPTPPPGLPPADIGPPFGAPPPDTSVSAGIKCLFGCGDSPKPPSGINLGCVIDCGSGSNQKSSQGSQKSSAKSTAKSSQGSSHQSSGKSSTTSSSCKKTAIPSCTTLFSTSTTVTAGRTSTITHTSASCKTISACSGKGTTAVSTTGTSGTPGTYFILPSNPTGAASYTATLKSVAPSASVLYTDGDGASLADFFWVSGVTQDQAEELNKTNGLAVFPDNGPPATGFLPDLEIGSSSSSRRSTPNGPEVQERGSDPSGPSIPWHLSMISKSPSGSYVYDDSLGSGQTIYIIDSGIAKNSETSDANTRYILAQPAEPGTSAEGDSGPNAGHGSLMASLAYGKTHGIARKANVVSIKFVPDKDTEYIEALASAIYAVVKDVVAKSLQGKAVINLSLSVQSDKADPGSIPMLKLVMERAFAEHIVIVTSSGNEGGAVQDYPALLGESFTNQPFIVVGSVDETGAKSSFSSDASYVQLYAPGGPDLEMIDESGAEEAGEGTSASSALVSGMVAYMRGLPDGSKYGGDPMTNLIPDLVTKNALNNGVVDPNVFHRKIIAGGPNVIYNTYNAASCNTGSGSNGKRAACSSASGSSSKSSSKSSSGSSAKSSTATSKKSSTSSAKASKSSSGARSTTKSSPSTLRTATTTAAPSNTPAACCVSLSTFSLENGNQEQTGTSWFYQIAGITTSLMPLATMEASLKKACVELTTFSAPASVQLDFAAGQGPSCVTSAFKTASMPIPSCPTEPACSWRS